MAKKKEITGVGISYTQPSDIIIHFIEDGQLEAIAKSNNLLDWKTTCFACVGYILGNIYVVVNILSKTPWLFKTADLLIICLTFGALIVAAITGVMWSLDKSKIDKILEKIRSRKRGEQVF